MSMYSINSPSEVDESCKFGQKTRPPGDSACCILSEWMSEYEARDSGFTNYVS